MWARSACYGLTVRSTSPTLLLLPRGGGVAPKRSATRDMPKRDKKSFLYTFRFLC
ncbi:MAG: hypothetical protein NZ455_06755 [Bacteroidia bacterium]|nr:hypothetical protein [Bacteroidia bacterium]MDW8346047.1 hypothetical protein [Bacteroidia bacterium]